MKSWHIGAIVLLLVAYFVGVKFPSFGNTILGKIGV